MDKDGDAGMQGVDPGIALPLGARQEWRDDSDEVGVENCYHRLERELINAVEEVMALTRYSW
jgi:hypothetical protein